MSEDPATAALISVLRARQRALLPEPELTVSQWADAHRVLSSRAAAEPGRYRTDRAPYLREIMDRLSPSDPCRRVVVMKAAQIGATEAGNNWIGYVIHHAPGPMLAVQPTVELAKRFSRQRVDQLIEDTPVLRQRVRPARERDSGNTLLAKEFHGGILVITGANSAVGLRSLPARYLFLDEVDAYPATADDEGDPVALAEARTLTFGHRRKIFLVSTPTIAGTSRIEREFDATDQRRYFVPCPHCGEFQALEFRRLHWDKGRPETAVYLCAHCDQPIREHHKTEMLARGEWRATAESQDPATVGYHLSSLYSPVGWLSWAQIARQWEQAQGSEHAIKAFRNTVLGETWIERGDAPDWERIYERREDWRIGTVPEGVAVLTAGVDVQRDRLEVSVWGWGPGLESWLVDHIVIEGGPASEEAWQELAELTQRSWPGRDGQRHALARLAIDTGYEAAAVYGWARRIGWDLVAPVKGREGWSSSPVAGPNWVDITERGRRLTHGARLWTVTGSVFKAELYRQLRLSRPTDEELAAGARYPAGYVHLPRGVDAEWVRQLVAEQLVTVTSKRRGGIARHEWQKLRERNEALDCRIYARAAAWILGVDRWPEDQWRARAERIVARRAAASSPTPRNDIILPPSGPAQRRPDWLGRRRPWL